MFLPNMSEFKYACPVCGQHIKCDSSQAGTQMECPTCFQKIIVPQAPAGQQSLILTGAKAANGRPPSTAPDSKPAAPPPSIGYSGAIVVFILLFLIAGAVAFVFQGTIFKRPGPLPHKKTVTGKRPQHPLIAPPANDTNWLLSLKGAAIPNSIAAGRINGQNFICQRAIFAKGALALRNGNLSVTVNFGGAGAEALAGKSLNVSTNAPRAARLVLRWKDDDRTMAEIFTNNYAMLLDFGKVTGKYLDGKIYLCTADEKKSYVAGAFKAEIRRPKQP
jgi:DNA-directed RNA polymerase subunit RPC12/RpoP